MFNKSANLFEKVFYKDISAKMTSIQSRGCLRQKHPSHSPVIPLDFSSSPKSEFFKQLTGSLGPKFFASATDVPKYSKNDMQ